MALNKGLSMLPYSVLFQVLQPRAIGFALKYAGTQSCLAVQKGHALVLSLPPPSSSSLNRKTFFMSSNSTVARSLQEPASLWHAKSTVKSVRDWAIGIPGVLFSHLD